MAPLPCGQTGQVQGRIAVHQIDRHPQQPQGGQANGSRHAAHLPVTPFAQF
jgi:hypothetical protein